MLLFHCLLLLCHVVSSFCRLLLFCHLPLFHNSATCYYFIVLLFVAISLRLVNIVLSQLIIVVLLSFHFLKYQLGTHPLLPLALLFTLLLVLVIVGISPFLGCASGEAWSNQAKLLLFLVSFFHIILFGFFEVTYFYFLFFKFGLCCLFCGIIYLFIYLSKIC